MIVLGVILLIVGLVTHLNALWTIGIVVLLIGAVLAVAGALGRPIGSRNHYF